MTTETKKTKKTKTTPKGAKVTKEFMFKLTEKESNEKGRAAAALKKEADRLDTEFDELKESWKAKIATRVDKYKELLDVVDAQEEKRTVDATLVHNYAEGTIEYWFEGKIMESRPMTDNERQKEMDLKPPKKARAQKQPLGKTEKHDPVAEAHAAGANGKMKDIAEVHKLETSRHTKTSAVDGPVRQ